MNSRVFLLFFRFIGFETLKIFDKTFLFGDEKHLEDVKKNDDSGNSRPWLKEFFEKTKRTLYSDHKGFRPLLEAGILSTYAGRLINLIVRELTTNCLHIFNEVGGKII